LEKHFELGRAIIKHADKDKLQELANVARVPLGLLTGDMDETGKPS
jgi:hypothetical protein